MSLINLGFKDNFENYFTLKAYIRSFTKSIHIAFDKYEHLSHKYYLNNFQKTYSEITFPAVHVLDRKLKLSRIM